MSSRNDDDVGFIEAGLCIVGLLILAPTVIAANAAEERRVAAKKARNRQKERRRLQSVEAAAQAAAFIYPEPEAVEYKEDDVPRDADGNELYECYNCHSFTADALERAGSRGQPNYYECLSCDNDTYAGSDD